ncbi:MAG: hypothetical protein E7287_02280 [Lachnospiraceae bacterium]|nr:hypothetical protein [Lachnospiraceae bacterium]
MKKDKSVKKAELKAAIISKLKSLIGPLIITAIIIAGVIFITTSETEEEVKEIVKANRYEGTTDIMKLENDELLFALDPATTHFEITVKDTGAVWKSIPDGAASDPIASKKAQEAGKVQSTLYVTYGTQSMEKMLYDNYNYGIINQIYNIEQGDDYIKVCYSVGKQEKQYTLPTAIREADYEKYHALMDVNQQDLMDQRYKKLDINNLGRTDEKNKDELLKNYPIMETEVIYVLRDGTKDNVRTKLEEYFAAAGYTAEEHEENKKLDMSTSSSDDPVFNVNVYYRLEGKDFVVEVPLNELEYRDDYPIVALDILPFFGAGGTEDEGFMLVPEGGGGIINFNNGKITQNYYYANLYGWNMATHRTEIVQETRTHFNVFGISKADNSFICILEDGNAYGTVVADISGKTNSFNAANAQYKITHRAQYDIADRFQGNMFVYQDELPDENLVNRYRFVDSGSYVDMAKTYNEYLVEKYPDEFTMNDDTEAPMAVEILGAVDKVTQVMGVPASRPLKLTSYKEADEIVSALKGNGINNMFVKLSGWANGGIRQELMTDVKLVSALGKGKDLKNFVNNANANGIPVYLDGITDYAYHSNFFDGFMVSRDAARYVTDEEVELYPFSKVTYGQLKSEEIYYLLKPSVIQKVVDALSDTAKKYSANISFRDIGRDLSSAYNEEEVTSRQAALLKQIEQVKAIKAEGMGVMVNFGNEFLAPYVDIVTNNDLKGTQYTIIDSFVPFYQLAVHGYLNYTGEALNLTQNMQDELLNSVEYGAGLYFTVMKESSFALQKTLYSEYFGASYDAWQDEIVEIYTRYNKELGHTYNQKMVNHESVGSNVACTTYEDGTKVYVNYTYEDYVTNGITIPARDYLVVR